MANVLQRQAVYQLLMMFLLLNREAFNILQSVKSCHFNFGKRKIFLLHQNLI